MKKSISRRSFIKRSSLGAMTIASGTLVTGLVTSAYASMEMCNDYSITEWTVSGEAPSQEEAQAAADGADPLGDRDNPTRVGQTIHINEVPACTDIENTIESQGKTTTVTEIDDALWAWTCTERFKTTFCQELPT